MTAANTVSELGANIAPCTAETACGGYAGEPMSIGSRRLETRYFLAPLAGYTHLAFRQVVRECGGVGLCTTDLVQASHLVAGTRWARELVKTNEFDRPLSVQIYGGVSQQLVRAAQWLQDQGYASIDINMGCPMAKVTGSGGGARLMCQVDGACQLVEAVVRAVQIPVTVKMRLGWDRDHITAPRLAREFEQLGVAAITIHGRTRQQGFTGGVNLEGIRDVVEAVDTIPIIGNGDVRTVADAWRMRHFTGCDAVAIGRGALLDPWIFRRLLLAEAPAGGLPPCPDDIAHFRDSLRNAPLSAGRSSSPDDAPRHGVSWCSVASREEHVRRAGRLAATDFQDDQQRCAKHDELQAAPPDAQRKAGVLGPIPQGLRVDVSEFDPPASEKLDFLRRHFELMLEQHGEFSSCLMFRKFAAWYGARLGIPEDLEDRLRRFESVREFGEIVQEIGERHGTRSNPRPTIEVKVPNGPVEYW